MKQPLVGSCGLLRAVSVLENDSVVNVARTLEKFQERRVFVLNKGGYPVGIISIVDINDRVVAKGRDLKKTVAKDIMSYPVHLVFDVSDSLDRARELMIRKDNYYVPVVEKKKLLGLLTYSCLTKSLEKAHGRKSGAKIKR